jgi:hypothetical protein
VDILCISLLCATCRYQSASRLAITNGILILRARCDSTTNCCSHLKYQRVLVDPVFVWHYEAVVHAGQRACTTIGVDFHFTARNLSRHISHSSNSQHTAVVRRTWSITRVTLPRAELHASNMATPGPSVLHLCFTVHTDATSNTCSYPELFKPRWLYLGRSQQHPQIWPRTTRLSGLYFLLQVTQQILLPSFAVILW